MKNHLFYSAAIIGTLSLFQTTAIAQTADALINVPPQAEIDETDEIIVTGSRLQNGAASEAVRVINFDEIEKRGITNMEQLLRQVSVNAPSISASSTGDINGIGIRNRGTPYRNLSGGTAVDLRGLGAGSTLVLINGRRIAGEGAANGDFADISNIAVESIERVEILTSGASAIYGADAVSGVVNIILKKDYSGTTVTARYGNSSSGADDVRLSATSGFNWDGGNFTVSGSYNQIDSVNASEFGFTTRDFRDQGGADRRALTSTRGVFYQTPDGVGLTGPDDFFTNNAYLLAQNAGPVDDFTDIGSFEAVSRDALGERLPISLIPDSETLSISGRLSQDINTSVVNTVFLDASYAKRTTKTNVRTPEIFINALSLPSTNFGIPFTPTDPDSFDFYRSDLDFRLDGAELVEAGILPNNVFDTEGENFALTGGLSGDFSKTWNWEASASYSENNDTDVLTGFNGEQLYFGIFDFDTFEDIVPATNVIRSDYLTNPEAQASLQNGISTSTLESKSDQLQLLGVVKGAFLTGRETGALDVSMGVDYRVERNQGTTTDLDVTGALRDRFDIDGKRTSLGLFAEGSIPLSERIILNGALRYEDVENTGETTTIDEALEALALTDAIQFEAIAGNTPFSSSATGFSPRIGAAWQVKDNFKLRATTGRSFRAPNAQEIGRPASAVNPFGITIDPQSGQILNDIIFDFDTFEEVLAPGSRRAPQVNGGNPDLIREVAQTLNLGAELSVDAFHGTFDFDVDYWKIDYDDRIEAPGFELLGDGFSGVPANEAVLRRNDAGQVDYIFEGPLNIAAQNLTGIDLKVGHRILRDDFGISSRIAVSRQFKNKRQFVKDVPFEDLLGIDSPKLRWNASSTLTIGNFDLTGVLNYTGGYTSRDVFLDFLTFENVTIDRDVDSFLTTDLQLQYNFYRNMGPLNGTRLKAGATNVFNVDAPFLDRFNGYDSSNYDLRRRVLYLEISKDF